MQERRAGRENVQGKGPKATSAERVFYFRIRVKEVAFGISWCIITPR